MLGAVTSTLYLVTKIVIEGDPIENFYLFGILAGLTGGIWGIGLNESLSFWKMTKSEDIVWYSEEAYRKTLHKWIIMGIISLLYVFFLSLLVNFFKL